MFLRRGPQMSLSRHLLTWRTWLPLCRRGRIEQWNGYFYVPAPQVVEEIVETIRLVLQECITEREQRPEGRFTCSTNHGGNCEKCQGCLSEAPENWCDGIVEVTVPPVVE